MIIVLLHSTSSNTTSDNNTSSNTTSDNNTSTNTTNNTSSNSTYVAPTAETYNNSTNSSQAETGSATAQDATVSVDKPVSSQGQVIDQKNDAVQILKFHSYSDQRTTQGIISFYAFLHFIGKKVPYSVILRLRVNYNSRLRNLQTGTADSLRSDCIITNENLYGTTNSDGISVNYHCTAKPTRTDSISKVQLNTDLNMVLAQKDGTVETVNFNSVSFDGNAAKESTTIQTNTGTLTGSMITISEAIAAISNNYLAISGTLGEYYRLLRRLVISDGETVWMDLKTYSNGQSEIYRYSCIYSVITSSSSGLLCDTSGNPISTTVEDLHLSTGNSRDRTFITVKMKDALNNNTALNASGYNKYSYRKSSSGLSGGAIAGIVIACIAVLAGITILAFLLRRPKPPIDTTTVIDLKNESTTKI